MEVRLIRLYHRSVLYKLVVTIAMLSLSFLSVRRDVTEANASASSNVPVDLLSVGYHGPWEQFCDAAEIEKDFARKPGPGHELRALRNRICELWKEKKVDVLHGIPLLAVYKYSASVRPQIDTMLTELISKLSQDDEKLRWKIFSKTNPGDNTSTCYLDTTSELDKHCIGRGNPYYGMFAKILSRTCAVRWLTTEDIISYMRILCAGKRIAGDIDWASLIASLNSTDPITQKILTYT